MADLPALPLTTASPPPSADNAEAAHTRHVFIESFGCQMNDYDVARMVEVMRRSGYERTDDEERAWVEPRLAHLLGLEERALGDARDLYAAWRVYF